MFLDEKRQHDKSGTLLACKRVAVLELAANDTEKRLGLPVPYGCALHDIQAEAEKAMRELSDIAKIAVNLPK
jgi:hypothetical protein